MNPPAAGFQATPPELQAETRAHKAGVPSLGLGHRKLAIPPEIRERLQAHWQQVKTRLVPRLQDSGRYLQTLRAGQPATLFHEDPEFNRDLLERLRPLHEAWYGGELVGSSCYGIRVYLPGAYLYSHVDTTSTHVVSSTLCIASDLDASWPLWIERDGVAEEVEILPGEMVQYESAWQEHGRPYPLVGRYYAGLFAHYRPRSWSPTG